MEGIGKGGVVIFAIFHSKLLSHFQFCPVILYPTNRNLNHSRRSLSLRYFSTSQSLVESVRAARNGIACASQPRTPRHLQSHGLGRQYQQPPGKSSRDF